MMPTLRVVQLKQKARGGMGSSQAADMGETTGQGHMGQGFDQGNLGRGFDNTSAGANNFGICIQAFAYKARVAVALAVRADL